MEHDKRSKRFFHGEQVLRIEIEKRDSRRLLHLDTLSLGLHAFFWLFRKSKGAEKLVMNFGVELPKIIPSYSGRIIFNTGCRSFH